MENFRARMAAKEENKNLKSTPLTKNVMSLFVRFKEDTGIVKEILNQEIKNVAELEKKVR